MIGGNVSLRLFKTRVHSREKCSRSNATIGPYRLSQTSPNVSFMCWTWRWYISLVLSHVWVWEVTLNHYIQLLGQNGQRIKVYVYLHVLDFRRNTIESPYCHKGRNGGCWGLNKEWIGHCPCVHVCVLVHWGGHADWPHLSEVPLFPSPFSSQPLICKLPVRM